MRPTGSWRAVSLPNIESETTMNRSSLRYIATALLALLLTACDLTPTPQPPTGPTIPASPEVQGVNTIVLAPTATPGEPTVMSTSAPTSTPTILPPTSAPTAAATANVNTIPTQTSASVAGCTPTRADGEGPFYVPNAPERASVGQGHMLRGVVRRSPECQPIPGAKIEFWQVGPDAQYDDAHRATLYSNSAGEYTFESNFPPGYSGRPPHIHLKVSVEGYRTFTTQFYPQVGQTEATFDLVLVP